MRIYFYNHITPVLKARIFLTNRITRLYSMDRKVSSNQVFTQKYNPITGKSEWELQDPDYDYHMEVARSAYGDMLHDSERNHKYYLALEKGIASLKKQNKPVKVLDIGTGTGLLAMMAAKLGADTVTACEAFTPMAKCAEKVISCNDLEKKIKLIQKRSTELQVGPGLDMEERSNILVTEVFDTELIGEGAIETFSHALEHLLEPDSIVIPASAVIYIQGVQSELAQKWHHLLPIQISDGKSIMPSKKMAGCSGAASVHDLQLTELGNQNFKEITPHLVAFRFDFTGKIPLKKDESFVLSTQAHQSGTIHCLFFWWELQMDMDGDITLSCAPSWAHPEPSSLQWRDHWMQAIYYLPEAVSVKSEEKLSIGAFHDDYNLWFNLKKANSMELESDQLLQRPICTCGLHVACSRTRLGMLNDIHRNAKYIQALKKVITPTSVCISISDGSLLPLMAAKLGAKKVFAIESYTYGYEITKDLVQANSLENIVTLLTKETQDLVLDDLNGEKVDILFGEPFFYTSILPWDALNFWYKYCSILHLVSPTVQIIPCKAIIRGVAVQTRDLWKIRAPVKKVEGFSMAPFDRMIRHSISISDAPVEPHPLWEYPSLALTEPFDILTIDLKKANNLECISGKGERSMISRGTCNGIALWIDFCLDQDTIIGTGPISPVVPGNKIEWDMYTRQGIYFFLEPRKLDINFILEFDVTYIIQNGDFTFDFNIKEIL